MKQKARFNPLSLGALGLLLAAGLAAGLAIACRTQALAANKNVRLQREPPDVSRARRTVKMLDDVYKTAVVLITEKYVKDEDSFPAGSAAVAWFAAIKKKGWHEVRILDATGKPYNDANTARDAFDRDAIKKLKAGKTFVEKVITRKGRRYLRAATPIPVVSKKCVMCHEHYAQAKKGEPIGLLSYEVPMD